MDSSTDEKSEINPYGDALKSSTTGFGSDVSSQRLTPFEEEIMERAAKLVARAGTRPVALDVFSGYCAANARRLADLGFTAYAVDFSPSDVSLTGVNGKTTANGGSLSYLQLDVRQFNPTSLERSLDLVTCQRGLHFLHFDEARLLVTKLAVMLNAGSSMYFSIGAVDCAVGPGYKHADRPVSERWHPLEPELGDPIHVTEPLCLYKAEDITTLFADAARIGQVVRLERDDFGLFVVEFKRS